MISRTFEDYKFKRTYIGGSKKREQELFLKVQGTKEDNSECDWFEYRRMLVQYFDDILHIILSWKIFSNNISIALIFGAVLFSFFSIIVSIFLIAISLFFQIFYQILKRTEMNRLKEYDFCLTIILSEIEDKTGLKIPKN